jgi:transposase
VHGAIEGNTDKVVFEAYYVEQVLAPTLKPGGRIVLMDNLSAHKGERVGELIERSGCELLFLPSYWPDLNPIEEAFSEIKEFLRRAEARTKEALVKAVGEALCAVSTEDARGFFEHCGYHAIVQLL